MPNIIAIFYSGNPKEKEEVAEEIMKQLEEERII